MEKKRNKIKTAPIRQEKYEKYLAKQIPLWNAARVRRLDARLAKAESWLRGSGGEGLLIGWLREFRFEPIRYWFQRRL